MNDLRDFIERAGQTWQDCHHTEEKTNALEITAYSRMMGLAKPANRPAYEAAYKSLIRARCLLESATEQLSRAVSAMQEHADHAEFDET